MVMQVQYRWASSGWAPAPSTRCHEGCAAVPLAVRNTMPLAWPTQTASESPGATASALMLEPALGLIADHRGPEVSVLGCLASSVRHSDSPPPKIVAHCSVPLTGSKQTVPRSCAPPTILPRAALPAPP